MHNWAEKFDNDPITLTAATAGTENRGGFEPEPNAAADPSSALDPTPPFSGIDSIDDIEDDLNRRRLAGEEKQTARKNSHENQVQKPVLKSDLPPPHAVAWVISHSRRLSLVFGVVIALAAGFYIWHQQTVADNLFHSFIDKAQLAAFDEDGERASQMLKNAIDTSAKLPLSKRVVAGLQLKYAHSLHRLIPETITTHSEKSRVNRAREHQALDTALSLYEQSPNSRSEQMMTLQTIESNYAPEYVEDFGTYDIFEDRARVFVRDDSATVGATIKPGISDDNVATMMRFLTNYRDPGEILDQLHASLQQCKKPADFEKFIPVYEQVVYHTSRLRQSNLVEYGETNLDWIVYQARNDKTNKYRLKLADEAFARHDWHGAIVEYGRYLSSHNDQAAQDRLVDARKKNRISDLGSRSDNISPYIVCLQKLKNLQEKAFGANDQATIATTVSLIDAHLTNEELSLAESEIKQLWYSNTKDMIRFARAITETDPSPPLSKEPKNATQLKLLWLQCRLELHKGQYNDAMTELEWIAHVQGVSPDLREFFAAMASECGRYDLADVQLKKSERRGPELSGSSSGVQTLDPLLY